jgi:predicted HicB family RNase H-like nuclease
MIDDYPAMCADHGLEPEQPPTEIMVPLPTELYAQAYSQAEKAGVSVQAFMQRAIQQSVS